MSNQSGPSKTNGIEIANLHTGGLKDEPQQGGRDPAPARHIPWPEIFKHHISIVEGHMKMINMVRKHTVEGTEDYQTICGLVDRTEDMLQISKRLAFDFVPSQHSFQPVPLSSSSGSIYPDFPPNDVRQEGATNEYSKLAVRARTEGMKTRPEGVEYVVSKPRGQTLKRTKRISEVEALGDPASGPNSIGPKTSIKADTTNARKEDVRVTDGAPKEERPPFVIDIKPTLVPSSNHSINQAKQRDEAQEPVATNVFKKAKKRHEGPLPEAPETNKKVLESAVEFEDISAEVDARMEDKEQLRVQNEGKKAKEASEKMKSETALDDSEGGKRKGKEDHKRKREPLVDEKPQKKIVKKAKQAELLGLSVGKKREAADLEESVEVPRLPIDGEKLGKKAKVSHSKDSPGKGKRKKRVVAKGEEDEGLVSKKRQKKKSKSDS